MPSEQTQHAALLDIAENIRHAQSFISGMDYEAFRDNTQVFYAATRPARRSACFKAASAQLMLQSSSASGGARLPHHRGCESVSVTPAQHTQQAESGRWGCAR